MFLICDIYCDIVKQIYRDIALDDHDRANGDTSVSRRKGTECLMKFMLSGKQHLIAVENITKKANYASFMSSQSLTSNNQDDSYIYTITFIWVNIEITVILIMSNYRTKL